MKRRLIREWEAQADHLEASAKRKAANGLGEEAFFHLGEAFQLRSCAAQLEFVEAIGRIGRKRSGPPAAGGKEDR